MTTDQLEKHSDTFIVAKTDDGYRVCSPLNPATQYAVSGSPLTCTCREFEQHADEPDWRCKHILAAEQYQARQNHHSGGGSGNGNSVSNGNPGEPPRPKKANAKNGEATMLIKRSVSPDGRIDSLSVEFSCPVGKITTEDIKQCAEKSLKLQAEIIDGFLQTSGKRRTPPQADDGAVPGNLLMVSGMDTRRGRSLFINVFVNGQVAKLFGTAKELGDTITAAGFPDRAGTITEGVQLNLPCRVVTRKNGKYLNIDRVLPAPKEG